MNRKRLVMIVLAVVLAGVAVVLAAKEVFGPGVSSGARVMAGLASLLAIMCAMVGAKAGAPKPR